MSDSDQTPETTTPAAPAPSTSGEVDILARKLGEQNQKVAALNEQLAAALRERDTYKESVGKLEPLAKEANDLRVKVEGFLNTAKEGAILERLRAQLPGAEVLAIRGVVRDLADAGKVNRYSDDASAEATKILELIKSEAPSLTRPPTGAGGSSVVASAPQPPKRKSLVG